MTYLGEIVVGRRSSEKMRTQRERKKTRTYLDLLLKRETTTEYFNKERNKLYRITMYYLHR